MAEKFIWPYCKELCVCVDQVLHRFQEFFSHITTVFGCVREFNAHFYSPALQKYHIPDTWYDTTPRHISQTLALPKNLCVKQGATISVFNAFGMSRHRIKPGISDLEPALLSALLRPVEEKWLLTMHNDNQCRL